MNNSDENGQFLIKRKIENLRTKLLNLSLNNPLIATKLHQPVFIRIVDVCPSMLCETLQNGENVLFASLPSLEEPLKDEESKQFKKALAKALKEDAIYLNDIKKDSTSFTAEFALRDRVREQLGWRPKETKLKFNAENHALNHGLNPTYEFISDKNNACHKTGSKLQTLLLPEVFEKQLKKLHEKSRTHSEEVGIDVLYIAFGFLEWQEHPSSDINRLAPLLLLSVKLEQKLSRKGYEFSIMSNNSSLEGNIALSQKLKTDFGIAFPEYQYEQTIEDYFQEVLSCLKLSKKINWTIKRWTTVGVFPSARLAMYQDLDPENPKILTSPLLQQIFGQSDSQTAGDISEEEYNGDDPAIEQKVPYLISDADSSQFSVIVDVMNDKNLVVEGPPGTGKSQTIVNTIAAALGFQKKVLFVAEKTAALDVVKRKLEDLGLGHFLLSLQVQKTCKNQVISSIKERLETKSAADPIEIDQAIKEFRQCREEMKEYLDLLHRPFGVGGLTVYQILGKAIALNPIYQNVPEKLKTFNIPLSTIDSLTEEKKVIALCKSIENEWKETQSDRFLWQEIKAVNLDHFTADRIIHSIDSIADLYFQLDKEFNKMKELGVFLSLDNITSLKDLLDRINQKNIDKNKLILLHEFSSQKKIDEFVLTLEKNCSNILAERDLFDYLMHELSDQTVHSLSKIGSIMQEYGLPNLHDTHRQQMLRNHEQEKDHLQEILVFFDKLFKVSEIFRPLKTTVILKTLDIVTKTPQDTISLRSEKLLDMKASLRIKKAHKNLLSLQNIWKELQEIFILQTLPQYDEISHHLSTLLKYSWFPILRSDYQNSRNFYLRHTIDQKFDKEKAIRDFKKLLLLLKNIQELEADHDLQSLVSQRYEGVETNLEPYILVMDYIDKVQEICRDQANQDLHNFLLSGANEKILLLPQIDPEHPLNNFQDKTFAQIVEMFDTMKNKLEKIKKDFSFLNEANFLTSHSKELNAQSILDLVIKLQNFIKEKQETEHQAWFLETLEKHALHPLTDKEELNKIVDIACVFDKLNVSSKEAFFHIINHDLFDKITPIISLIVDTHRMIKEKISILSDLACAPIKSWDDHQNYEEIADYLKKKSQDKQSLISQSHINSYITELNKQGYQNFTDDIVKYLDPSSNIPLVCQSLIASARARHLYEEYGYLLRRFHGNKLSDLRKQIKELDARIIRLSRERLKSKLYREAYPEHGKSTGKKSELTEMALIKHEIAKKSRFIPIRHLTNKAGKSLLEIKPCWLMSPLSVAHYINKEKLHFDLVIMDEASQITPEDAVGSLVRGKQVMIVGDTNQLPPTSFFRKMTEDDIEEDDHVITDECILGMATAVFKNSRKLRWHYRSKHESLIDFSNKHIYENNLILFPSPSVNALNSEQRNYDPKKNNLGVHLTYIKDGLYTDGINNAEAETVVSKALMFMQNHPNRSLGIVSLNRKQQDLLVEKMDMIFEQNDTAKAYREKWENIKEGSESFFIKNLENVQGDERDVIFISTVYGPEKLGSPVMQRFGPISSNAGRRRLNVLFTRAKEQMVTFTSLRSADIKADETKNTGSSMLKLWLEYCAAGGNIHNGTMTYAEPDSDFERHVISQIKLMGCEARPQVGVSGYFIDIGVRHPSCPDRYILGVECDGASYHSSKSARDRDRLRQDVLEAKGWSLYRIWSTDWFNNPLREIEKLREEITNKINLYIQ